MFNEHEQHGTGGCGMVLMHIKQKDRPARIKLQDLWSGKAKRIPVPIPHPFTKKAMEWWKNWLVQMNFAFFFAVEAYVPGGVQNQAEKKSKNAFRPVPVPKSTFPVWQTSMTRKLGLKPQKHRLYHEVAIRELVVGCCWRDCRQKLVNLWNKGGHAYVHKLQLSIRCLALGPFCVTNEPRIKLC